MITMEGKGKNIEIFDGRYEKAKNDSSRAEGDQVQREETEPNNGTDGKTSDNIRKRKVVFSRKK